MHKQPTDRLNPKNLQHVIISAAIFIVALLVRAAPMGRYVTPDEPIWVLRSVKAADALATQTWGAIPQTGHPGISTMALGALGIRIMEYLAPQEATAHLAWLRNLAWLAPENGEAFPHLAFFLPAGRWLVMLTTAAGIAAAYWIARTRLEERGARILALCLALDPFFAGHGGLLHTDALQATFVFLAVLLALPPKQRTQRISALAAAGLCLACAGMTKTLGFLAAPGLALALLLLEKAPLKQRLLHITLLTLFTVVAAVLIYPPLWSNPRAAVTGLVEAIGYHEAGGNRPVFFAGTLQHNPGGAFYPVVLLFRLTPPVLIGLLLVFITQRRWWSQASTTGWFLLPLLTYLVPLTIAEKKFDRYVLSAVPLLTAIAATAWARRPLRWRWAIAAALLLPWALVAPLPLYYANPLLGGPWVANTLIPLGWGEGTSLTTALSARTLSHPESATLLTDDVPAAASRFPGRTQPYTDYLRPCGNILLLTSEEKPPTGYRQIAAPEIAGLSLEHAYAREMTLPQGFPLLAAGPLPGMPEDTEVPPTADARTLRTWLVSYLSIGESFTWIHAPACFSVTEAQLRALLDPVTTCTPLKGNSGNFTADSCTLQASIPEGASQIATFGSNLALVSVAMPEALRSGETLRLGLRWQALALLPQLEAQVALEDASGSIWRESDLEVIDTRYWLPPTWEPGSYVDQEAKLSLPQRIPPGVYTVTLRLRDNEGRKWGAWTPDGTFEGTRLDLGALTVLVGEAPSSSVGMKIDREATAPGLQLLGVTPPPETIWAGEPLPFQLGWERTDGDPATTLQWALRCNGSVQDSGILELAPSAPTTWPTGYRYRIYYRPRTAALMAGGSCQLVVTPPGGTPIEVGTVTIHQRERTFALSTQPQHPLSITAGHAAQLLGVDISASTITAGEMLTVTLTWQAMDFFETNLTAFVHLLGDDGQLWAQSDHWPQDGGAPTTSWIPEQIIADSHALVLPQEMPPGIYRLTAGLYDAESGERFPLYEKENQRLEGDQVELMEISIKSP